MSKKKQILIERTPLSNKERIRAKKLAKSLIDMENIRFSTARQLQAVNEVLEMTNEVDNARVHERAMHLYKKLTIC